MPVQTINISLPKELLQEVDAAAKAEYATRSDYIRQALVRRLRTPPKITPSPSQYIPVPYPERAHSDRQRRTSGTPTEEARTKAGRWDGDVLVNDGVILGGVLNTRRQPPAVPRKSQRPKMTEDDWNELLAIADEIEQKTAARGLTTDEAIVRAIKELRQQS